MAHPHEANVLSRAELAKAAAVEEAFVEQLTELSILELREGGRAPTDVYRVRFADLVTQAGISLAALARAMAAGVVSFGDLEMLFPDPVRASDVTHGELATEIGIDMRLLGNTRLAAGLAARDADELVPEDEASILRSIFTLAQALDDPGLATRIARTYGERTRRIASSSLGIYDEYVTRPLAESGAVIDPATARRSSEQARGLMDLTQQLLMDLYQHHSASATLANWAQLTETLLERHGYVATRPKVASAIAFVDLSGFTRLTDEEGDEVGPGLPASSLPKRSVWPRHTGLASSSSSVTA